MNEETPAAPPSEPPVSAAVLMQHIKDEIADKSNDPYWKCVLLPRAMVAKILGELARIAHRQAAELAAPPEGEEGDDALMAFARAHLPKPAYDALTITRWKDGIDIDYPTADLRNFAAALLATTARRAEEAEARVAKLEAKNGPV